MAVEASLPQPFVRAATSSDLEALFRLRHCEFIRVATAITGNREAAEDAVQEGLARALARRRTFRGAGSLEAWLWRVVINAAKSSRRRVEPLAAEPSGELPAPRDAHLRSVIAALPERQRLVLFLRYYADLDYATIAAALGIERGTVSATLSQAHAAVRRQLEGWS
jgi:RNA polymerase sigma-70 factor (ECF subfamily)